MKCFVVCLIFLLGFGCSACQDVDPAKSMEPEITAVESALPDSLQKMIKLAEHSPNADLFYNLGVDFFALGLNGYSNLYYLKALNLNSAHRQARANLETSQRFGADAALYPQRLFLVRVLFQVLNYFNVQRLAVLGLVFLLFSALAFIWLLYYDPEKERALPILSLSLFLLMCTAAFVALGIKSYAQKHNPQAVVMEQSSDFYPPTGTDAKPLLQVHAGLLLRIVDSRGEFHLVRLPNGELGRIRASHIRRVL